MAELNLADRPWCMRSHMLCNYMRSWHFSHSISALASGTGGYTCARGCKIQHQSHPSRCLVSVYSLLLLKTDSHPLQFQRSSLPSHLHGSFISPSRITELLPGCWHAFLTHFSLQLSELPISYQLQMLQSI